ncbi:MAG: trigger factor [Epulopiscium sp. Nele67-Bin002]|nr:MAG: trigger factor [Epulopiscium sp. Nele67-Bin002]
MNTSVEVLENSQVKLIVEVGQGEVTKAIDSAYKEMKKDFNVQGFRKGKVPKAMIEKMYGSEVFFNNAADIIIDNTFGKAIMDNDIKVVARLRKGDLTVEKMSKDAMKYTAIIAIKPVVELGQYKNLTIEADEVVVTDEEINEEIAKEVNKNAREIKVTDRAVMPQDKVTIDFKGFVDGEAFAGGEANDHPLVIGSGSFIPGFEEQLIGKNIGDTFDVNVDFPQEYHSEELKGKSAVFNVTIKDIDVTELPEVNDDFAADISEFDTLDEYKADLRATLLKTKEDENLSNINNTAIDLAVKNATFTIPEAMIEEEIDNQMSTVENNMKRQGIDFAQYLQFTGMDMDEFRNNFRAGAITQISGRIVLEEVAKQENVEIPDSDLDKQLEKMAEQYKMPVEEVKLVMRGNIEPLREDLKTQKAMDIITSSAQVVKKQ